MILPDLNLLLYAYNPHMAQHDKARDWWEAAVNGEELIGLPHEVTFGFVRIATNPRLGRASISLAQARHLVESWLQLPQVRVLVPGARHFARVMDLMTSAMATGAVVSDAILAAYAMEHRACLWTNDADFSRFPGLIWRNPLT
ncbi:MAG: PIN domain-containing protein [Candidatus Eremiobacteraeota bacterium]|nr:PIN domain-containing protein [Candidatus Eremiobacteraeota bacterium]MCW5870837.1 PIN domain-containing protein [Candidatus Eremiobacteraeota bacterium]